MSLNSLLKMLEIIFHIKNKNSVTKEIEVYIQHDWWKSTLWIISNNNKHNLCKNIYIFYFFKENYIILKKKHFQRIIAELMLYDV